jgi:hypothetical protein
MMCTYIALMIAMHDVTALASSDIGAIIVLLSRQAIIISDKLLTCGRIWAKGFSAGVVELK